MSTVSHPVTALLLFRRLEGPRVVQVAQLAEVQNPRRTQVDVHDRLDRGRRRAAPQVADRLDAVHHARAGDVLLERLELRRGQVRHGDEPGGEVLPRASSGIQPFAGARRWRPHRYRSGRAARRGLRAAVFTLSRGVISTSAFVQHLSSNTGRISLMRDGSLSGQLATTVSCCWPAPNCAGRDRRFSEGSRGC